MDYKAILKFLTKLWIDLEKYAETFNWGIIGACVFIILFGLFIYDSIASSQISLKFLLILGLFMVAVYYFGGVIFGDMFAKP